MVRSGRSCAFVGTRSGLGRLRVEDLTTKDTKVHEGNHALTSCWLTSSSSSSCRRFSFHQILGRKSCLHFSVGVGGRRRIRSACAGLCRSEEHTSELQSLRHLVCRLLL